MRVTKAYLQGLDLLNSTLLPLQLVLHPEQLLLFGLEIHSNCWHRMQQIDYSTSTSAFYMVTETISATRKALTEAQNDRNAASPNH